MKPFRNLFAVLLAALLGGCVTLDYSPEVAKGTGPDPDKGYLMGRFTREGENQLEIGLKLTCGQNCPDQVIKFKKYPPYDVMAINVVPGTYSVASIHFVNRSGGLIHQKNIEKPIGSTPYAAPFMVEAGKMYYLGDIVGETSVKAEGGYIHYGWRVKSYTYRPKETSEIFLTEHPEFRGINIEEPFQSGLKK